MSTDIRPELSTRNKYWISKNRYYELKHFCLQYHIWKKAHASIDGYSIDTSLSLSLPGRSLPGDPTVRYVETRDRWARKIELVEKAATDTDDFFAPYILKGVTEGLSFDKLRAQTGIPCGKDAYYDLYRRFFWLLSDSRK